MVYVGNINQSVGVLLKMSSLFDPFLSEIGTGIVFLDCMHCHISGWEIGSFNLIIYSSDEDAVNKALGVE